MLLATFNINNVNHRLDNLLAWLRGRKPDVVCLQELKAATSAFPASALESVGYRAVWVGQKTWNGVAILSRGVEPVLIRSALPGDSADTQARYVEAAVRGVVVACLYAPNGNPQPGPKFDYKLAWLDRLHRHATGLRRTGAPVALVGDFNVAPTDIDIYPTRSWDDDALVQPESRAAFRRLVGRSWTDALRALHPGERVYTFWDYKRNRWPRDAGLRLDHILLNAPLAERLEQAGVDRELRGLDGASDHAPVWARLRQT
ncbi:exodeoxyribonuclease III [Arvimicrobium flavum]|uniref:exodeoxyribonuclease III n=1 Tax=Arvimicrobium flavum TaxID=3393320 RepID=UPI00237BCF97|nr:exodeoxyribonuclease III [Mesorhizobium shangrilense]